VPRSPLPQPGRPPRAEAWWLVTPASRSAAERDESGNVFGLDLKTRKRTVAVKRACATVFRESRQARLCCQPHGRGQAARALGCGRPGAASSSHTGPGGAAVAVVLTVSVGVRVDSDSYSVSLRECYFMLGNLNGYLSAVRL
jgi:hypothetical protein